MTALHPRVFLTALSLVVVPVVLPGQEAGRRLEQTTLETSLELLPVQGDVYMLAGAGGNITLQVADEGVLVVDTGAPGTSDRVLAAIGSLSKRPIRYIINTSVDADHTAGNAALSKAGVNMAVNAPGNSGLPLAEAPIIAREQVMSRMSAPTGQPSPVPFAGWPTSTYFTPKKTMAFGREPIEILAAPAAHTDGDALVFFRRSDVVTAGDVLNTTSYPVFDTDRGGSIRGIIDALNRIVDIAIPRFNQQDGTLVVPGHGRICNEADVVEYRDMTTIVRDRIQTMIRDRMTLQQIKMARPTRDYDGVYGASSGPWTTEMFIDAVYRDLSRSR